jgi:hypothetical protein
MSIIEIFGLADWAILGFMTLLWLVSLLIKDTSILEAVGERQRLVDAHQSIDPGPVVALCLRRDHVRKEFEELQARLR